MTQIDVLRAYHGDAKIKAKYLARVAAHREADELVQGTGFVNGRGCAIGCTLDNYDHSRYPVELGLPEWLARLEDSIFESLPKAGAMKWPEQFLKAIPIGANVEPVRHKLAILRLDRLIVSQQSNRGKHGKKIDAVIDQTVAAIEQVKAFHYAEVDGKKCDWSAAESAARSVASAAWSAAESAAESAARSVAWSAENAAWSAAESAAERAAWSAESAAWSAAESAAESARSAAESAWSAAESAWSAARSATESAAESAWRQEAKDLLRLLEECTPDQSDKSDKEQQT